MSIPRPTPTDILCTVDWRGTSNTTTTKESTRHWTRRHLPKYSCRERLTMMTIAAVAPLRPRPFGPPLRGRAALHDGSGNRWPCWPPRQEKERRRFYLKLVAPWSKIGGKRKVYIMNMTTKEWQIELGQHLRNIRLRQNLDQRTLAERAPMASMQ